MGNYISLSKFSSARDELLYMITNNGWANDSDGRSESPTGSFALIIIEPTELAEVAQSIASEIADMEQYDDFDPHQLIGYFVCQENELGHWNVIEFGTADGARESYACLEADFAAYNGDLDMDED